MDEDEKYNRKLESGLYSLQLIAVILGHLWTSDGWSVFVSSKRLVAGDIFIFLRSTSINISMLKVVFEDHRTYGSPAAVSVRESLWQSLEEDMIPSFSTARSNWLDVQPKLLANKLKQSNVYVAGEVLKVDIGFKNPLQISVSISNVSLMCEHSARSDEREPDAKSSTSEQQSAEELGKLATRRELCPDVSLFTLSEGDISLEGGETVVAQITVTPRVEGILKIIGVRWKLSGSIVGFYNFEPDLLKKKVKGRKSKQSTGNKLEFLVIKSQPKLEGFIHHLPKTVHAGELQRLSLELRNPSEIPVKKVKIKISHPRFLKIGNREVVTLNFPACLEKKENSAQDDVHTSTINASETVFLVPEDTVIEGDTPFLLPLWLRAAAPGNISLYLVLYYEIEDKSAGMRYRTLRMHYNLEVLPSLDVSFNISPCPSRLQEFLVRMDVINRTRSESFKLHQLSSIGKGWEISLLQPIDTIFPSGYLLAGQALSCFLKLKNGRTAVTAKGEGMDVRLSQDSSEALFDTCSSPLVDFHHYERVHQQATNQVHQTTVDFILISQIRESQNNPTGVTNSHTIFSHHACHCSISSTSPIWWLMEGPHTIYHNFSASFCEIKLRMVIHNSSDFAMSVHVDAFDSTPGTGPSTNITSVGLGNRVGWHDTSTPNDTKVSSDIPGSGVGKSALQDCISPFVWSGSSSTRVKLAPMSTTEVPLLACVFCPGTYDLSNYALHWSIVPSNNHGDKGSASTVSSGTCLGHPFYLTVLQQD